MKQCRVKKNDQIANWVTPNTEFDKIAIHLPGLPNKPTPIPGITEFLIGQGYAVLQPHYSGTYDSGGKFDPYIAYECIDFWKKTIENGQLYDVKEASEINAPKSLALLSCHSFGTYAGMTALRKGLVVPKVIFFCTSFAYGEKGKEFGQVGDKTKHSRYVRDAYSLTFRTTEPDIIEEFFTIHSKGDLEVKSVDGITQCFIVSPGADPTGNPIISQKGSRDFIESHPNRFKIIGSMIAKNSGHGVHEMVKDVDVAEALKKWLEK